MKKNVLKATGAVMALTLLVSSFSACGSSKKAENPGATADSKSGQTVEIKVPVYDRGVQGEPPVDNNYWTKWVQDNALKAINVKVTYVPIPRTQDVDKFNMLLAANDAPDIINSYDFPVISAFYSRGALQEIPQATLDKYGSNLQTFLGKDLLKYGAINGKQYLIPAKRPMLGDMATTIRKDWLDTLGMKVPTNTDELYTVLKAFKEKDPGKLGAGNVIPMGVGIITDNALRIPDYGFRPDNLSEEEFAMYSDLILPALSWAPTKETLKYYNKLYNDGLISPDFALDKDNKKLEADATNGKVGMFALRVLKSPPVFSTILKNNPNAKFAPVTALQLPGKKPSGYGYYPFGMLNGINKNTKNPEAVVKFLDWMSSKDVLTTLQNGFEGKNYKTQDGLPIADGNYKGDERLILGTNKDYFCLVSEQRDLGDMDKNIKLNAIAQAPEGLTDYYIENYKASLATMNTQNFLFNQAVTSLNKNQKTLIAKWEEAAVKLVMCKPSDFDSTYDKYSKEYLASGYQEVLDEKKKIYNDMKKK